MRIRRALPLVAAIVLLVLAAFLGSFASDLRSWQGTFAQDDVRFRAQRSHVGLWRSPAVLPGDPARAVLGIGDALRYRRALQLFWFSIAGSSTGGQADLSATRAVAQDRLQTLMATAKTAEERSTAANLLGYMTVTQPADSPTQKAEIATATAYFRRAVVEDPANYAAKLNLELLLRIGRPGKSRIDQDARGGFGFGGANGVGAVGGGF